MASVTSLGHRRRHPASRRSRSAIRLTLPLRDAIMRHPRLAIFLGFLCVLGLGGGVARWDALSLLYVRPAAVVTIGLMALAPGQWDWTSLRAPLILLVLFTLTIAIQLVPLPPALWGALPGHAPYLEAATIAGIPQPWRPISLIPHRTMGSLIATLPAFATLIAMAGIPRRDWRHLAHAVMILCCLSALLGALQFGTGALYPYDPSDTGLPIGLLANRNHQALLLVIGIVLFANWGVDCGWNGPAARSRMGLALAAILIFCTVILLTGSRAGLVLMLIVVTTISLAILVRMIRKRQRSIVQLVLILAPLAMIALAAYVARNSGAVRFNDSIGDLGEDMRLLALPTVWKIAGNYFPIGTGFGTFDRVFMQFEPDWLLKRSFYNRAHSDPLEVLITGGLPSLVVVAAFLLFYIRRTIRAFTPAGHMRSHLPKAAALSILCALGASVVDYPLRTPLMSVVFVILCGLSYRGSAGSSLRNRTDDHGPSDPSDPIHLLIEEQFIHE